MKLRNLMIYGLIMVLCITMIGCSPKSMSEPAMGRYVEEEIELPEGLNNAAISSMLSMNEENQLEVVCYKNAMTHYTINSDGSFQTKDDTWMDTFLENRGFSDVLYLDGMDGNEYFMVASFGEDTDLKAYLFRHTSNGEVEEIKIKEFDDYKEYSGYRSYLIPSKMYVTKDGDILIGYPEGAVFYDGSGVIKYQIDQGQGGSIVVIEDTLYMLNDKANQVVSYDLTTGMETGQIDVSNRGYMDYYGDYSLIKMFAGIKGELYLVNYDGIHKLSAGGGIWETIVDGSINSICLPSNIILSGSQDKEGNFYLLCVDEDYNRMLYKYRYDEKIPTVPSIELSIYSLFSKKTIVQAIVEFQKQYEDVKISYHVALPDEYEDYPTIDTSDYIRALNTELLAGNGDDLIILDGLDTETYIEKGVLEDISDVIQPMVETGQLYKAIANTYERNGKIYAMPVSFKLPVVLGKTDAVDMSDTMENLANYVLDHKEESIFGTISNQTLATLLCEHYYLEMMDEAGNYEESKIIDFLNRMKVIAEHTLGEELPSENDSYGAPGVNEGDAHLAIEEYAKSSVFCVAIQSAEAIQGEWKALNGQYRPKLVVGLNRASKEKEYAKEFMNLLLSEKMQVNEYEEGMSVNRACATRLIEPQEGRAYSDHLLTYGYGVGGEFKTMSVEVPSVENRERYQGMLEELDTPILIDLTIEKKLVEVAERFLRGELNAKEAASEVMQFITTYSQE